MISDFKLEYDFGNQLNGFNLEERDLLDEEDTSGLKIYIPSLMPYIPKSEAPTETLVPVVGGFVTETNYIIAELSGNKENITMQDSSVEYTKYLFEKKRKPDQISYTLQQGAMLECKFVGGRVNKLMYSITKNEMTTEDPEIKIKNEDITDEYGKDSTVPIYKENKFKDYFEVKEFKGCKGCDGCEDCDGCDGLDKFKYLVLSKEGKSAINLQLNSKVQKIDPDWKDDDDDDDDDE